VTSTVSGPENLIPPAKKGGIRFFDYLHIMPGLSPGLANRLGHPDIFNSGEIRRSLFYVAINRKCNASFCTSPDRSIDK
jgi:hypothetical protein